MFLTNFKIAIASLRATRMRTILTTIGIMIGVASILLVFAVGQGAREKTRENLSTIPVTTYVLRSGNGIIANPSIFETPVERAAPVFTEHDLLSLQEAKLVSSLSPLMPIEGSVKYHSTVAKMSYLNGTSESIFKLLGLKFVDGQAFDDDSRQVVLGHEVAEKLFGTELSSGNTLTIRGDTYSVVGVLAQNNLPNAVVDAPVDNSVFLPYQQAKNYTQGVAQFSKVFISAPEDKLSSVSGLLTKNHNNETDFSILSPRALIGVSNDTFETMSLVTVITAAISLVIGGIGIMNIMLVNVTERTREIGIRKSIGASNLHILIQFLIESVVMSVAGGILGCLLAMAIGVVGGLFLPFGILFTWQAVLLALCLALGVGIVFGLFPAVRAARKDTIEALRYYQ